MKVKAWPGQDGTAAAGGAAGRRRVSGLLVTVALVLGVTPLAPRAAWGASGTTSRVSVESSGAQGNSTSEGAAVSADGRYLAFSSHASNLVADDSNGTGDVFVHDRQTGATTRVSLDSSGAEANGSSGTAGISADGRYVSFGSHASNLVAGDTNGTGDVFVHDRQTGATTRVSVDSSGAQANASSAGPAISADGRHVAFQSSASNLVPADTNAATDVFVHDRETGATTRVSVDSSGAQAKARSGNNFSGLRSAISADGRHVAFQSSASNLVPADTNAATDVFVHDRGAGATTRVSVDSSGAEANGHSTLPSLSADGNHVAFLSSSSNLVAGDSNGKGDLFVHSRQSGTTTRVSVNSSGGQANNNSGFHRISADGRHLSFDSDASNLVTGDTNSEPDIFVHDRHTGTTMRVSVDSSGTQANEGSRLPDISDDGRVIAFHSSAWNLVSADTNGQSDVFVHELSTPEPPTDTTPPQAPTVTLADPVNAANQAAVSVTGTGEAGTTALISVDDEESATPPVTATAAVLESGYSAVLDLSSLSDGTLTATVTLTDAAGNTGPAGTDTATKDTVAPATPTVALTDPVNPRNQASVTVSGTGEAGTTAHISVDDDDPATAAVTATAPVSGSGYSAALDLSSLSNGTLTATVSLTDAAGNTGLAGTDNARKVGRPVDRGPGPAALS